MTPMVSDEARRQGKDTRPQWVGLGLPVTFRCDFCRLIKHGSAGRKRVNGALWKCAACGAK